MNHLGLHFSEITIQIFTHLSLKLFVFLGTVVKAVNGLEVCPPLSELRDRLDSSLCCVEPQPTSLSPLLLERKSPSFRNPERHIRSIELFTTQFNLM